MRELTTRDGCAKRGAMAERRDGREVPPPDGKIEKIRLPKFPKNPKDRGDIDIHCPSCGKRVFMSMSLEIAATEPPVECSCGAWVSPAGALGLDVRE